jgi:hypothetical protein
VAALRVFEKLGEVEEQDLVFQDVHDADVPAAILAENVDLEEV